MSGPNGVALTAGERRGLLAALSAAGLDTSPGVTWDSLDGACVLAVLEHSLGVVLGPGAHPRALRSAPALERAVAEHGIRRPARARLRLELANPAPGAAKAPRAAKAADAAGAVEAAERERRRTEYRLGLARPGARVAVARRGPLSIWATADTAADLPLAGDALAALDLGAPVATGPGRPGPGRGAADVARGAAAGQVAATIETQLRRFVAARSGELWAPANPMVTVTELRRLGYYEAHPEQVVHLGDDTALLPAACLGAFRSLAATPVLATFPATVFRREPRYEPATGRLPSYTCRELLWHTAPEQEAALADAVVELLADLADRLGLRWRWCDAHDPFFLAEGAGGGKRELRAACAAGEIAIASVNAHGRHFTDRGYGCPGWHTGCAGLGIERWALAAGADR